MYIHTPHVCTYMYVHILNIHVHVCAICIAQLNEIRAGFEAIVSSICIPTCTCTCTYRYCEHVRYVVQVRGNAEGTCDTDLHEEEPRDMTVGISIHNLLKIYDDVSTCTPRARHLLSMVYI